MRIKVGDRVLITVGGGRVHYTRCGITVNDVVTVAEVRYYSSSGYADFGALECLCGRGIFPTRFGHPAALAEVVCKNTPVSIAARDHENR